MTRFQGIPLIVFIMACISALCPLSAWPAQKVAVEIIHSGTDIVGSKLIYQIKESIRRSSGLKLTNINEDRLIVVIVTIEHPAVRSGTSMDQSAIGITFVWGANSFGGNMKLYLNSTVGICGTNRVKDQAEDIVAQIDKEAEFLRK